MAGESNDGSPINARLLIGFSEHRNVSRYCCASGLRARCYSDQRPYEGEAFVRTIAFWHSASVLIPRSATKPPRDMADMGENSRTYSRVRSQESRDGNKIRW